MSGPRPEEQDPAGGLPSQERRQRRPGATSRARGVATADSLAAQIEADMAAAKLPAGALFGREQDLCVRYGVSAAILGQAARLLESRGVAAMRRGNNGGLVVRANALGRIGNLLGTYFEFVGVDVDEGLSIVTPLAENVAVLAALRLSLDDADRLRLLVDEVARAKDPDDLTRKHISVFCGLAAATGNPALELAMATTTTSLYHLTPQDVPPSLAGPADFDVGQIVAAVIGGDIGSALAGLERNARAVRRYDEQARLLLARRASDRQRVHPIAAGHAHTRGARLTHQMLMEIRRTSWPVGQRLGREEELLEQYGVGRATLRQAVRLLEEYGAVVSRRGRDGGLFVASPDSDRIETMARTALQERGLDRAQADEALAMLVTIAHRRSRDNGRIGEIMVAADDLQNASRDQVPDALARVIAAAIEASESKVIAMLVRITAGSLRAPSGPSLSADASRALGPRLSHALAGGDDARAIRALRDMVAGLDMARLAGTAKVPTS